MHVLRRQQMAGVRLITSDYLMEVPEDLQGDTSSGSFNVKLPLLGECKEGDSFTLYRLGSWAVNPLNVVPTDGTLAGAGSAIGYGDNVSEVTFILQGTDWTVIEPVAGFDFWRSNNGADLPSGATDYTNTISHDGSVSIGTNSDPRATLDVSGGIATECSTANGYPQTLSPTGNHTTVITTTATGVINLPTAVGNGGIEFEVLFSSTLSNVSAGQATLTPAGGQITNPLTNTLGATLVMTPATVRGVRVKSDNLNWQVTWYTLGSTSAPTIQQLNATGSVTSWSSIVEVGAVPLTANITLTLPTVVGNTGKDITFIRRDNTAFTVSIAGFGAQVVTLQSAGTELNSQNGALTVTAIDATNARQSANIGTAPVVSEALVKVYGATYSNAVNTPNNATGFPFTVPSSGRYRFDFACTGNAANSTKTATFAIRQLAAVLASDTESSNVNATSLEISGKVEVDLVAGTTYNAFITWVAGTRSAVDFDRIYYKKVGGFLPVAGQASNFVNVSQYSAAPGTNLSTVTSGANSNWQVALAVAQRVSLTGSTVTGSMAVSATGITIPAAGTYSIDFNIGVANTAGGAGHWGQIVKNFATVLAVAPAYNQTAAVTMGMVVQHTGNFLAGDIIDVRLSTSNAGAIGISGYTLKVQQIGTTALAADAIWSTTGNTNTAAKTLGSTDSSAVNITSGTGALTLNGATAGLIGVGTATPLSKLDVVGSVGLQTVSTAAAAYTVLATDYEVNLTLNGLQAVTLPAAASFTRRTLMLVNPTVAATKTVTAYTNLTGASVTTIPQNGSITLQSDGVVWRLVSQSAVQLSGEVVHANTNLAAAAVDIASIVLPAGTYFIAIDYSVTLPVAATNTVSLLLTDGANIQFGGANNSHKNEVYGNIVAIERRGIALNRVITLAASTTVKTRGSASAAGTTQISDSTNNGGRLTWIKLA